MITLTLPYPVSANRYWRTRTIKGVAMTYVSAEAKEYRKQVAQIVAAAGINQPFTDRVSIHFQLYPKRPQDWAKRAAKDPNRWDDTVQCLDVGNAEKVMTDALIGLVLLNDNWQVRRNSGERMVPDGEARLVVTIAPIADPLPQGTLF